MGARRDDDSLRLEDGVTRVNAFDFAFEFNFDDVRAQAFHAKVRALSGHARDQGRAAFNVIGA